MPFMFTIPELFVLKFRDLLFFCSYTENKSYSASDEAITSEEQELLRDTGGSVIGQIFNCGRHKNPTKMSENVVATEIFVYCKLKLLMSVKISFFNWKFRFLAVLWQILLYTLVLLVYLKIVKLCIWWLEWKSTRNSYLSNLSCDTCEFPILPIMCIILQWKCVDFYFFGNFFKFLIWYLSNLDNPYILHLRTKFHIFVNYLPNFAFDNCQISPSTCRRAVRAGGTERHLPAGLPISRWDLGDSPNLHCCLRDGDGGNIAGDTTHLQQRTLFQGMPYVSKPVR